MKEDSCFTVDWKLEKGMLFYYLKDSHSYHFYLGELYKTAWCFKTCLTMDGLRVSISPEDEGNLGKKIVEFACHFDLLLYQKELDRPRSFRGSPLRHVLNFEKGCVTANLVIVPYCKIDALKDDDQLLLRCRIWPCRPFLRPVTHFVQSVWKSLCFTWIVNDFCSFQRGDRVNYQLRNEDGENLLFDLFLQEDNDTLYIQETNRKYYFWIHCIWVLNAGGEKLICMKNNYYPPRLGNPLEFSLLVLKSKLLENREKFLPNNQLTLFFDLRKCDFTGRLEEIFIDDSMDYDGIPTFNTHDIYRRKTDVDGLTANSSSLNTPEGTLATQHDTTNPPNSSTANDMYRLYTEGQLTDFEIAIGSETVQVHKNILAARSPVFLDMLTNERPEVSQHRYVIEDLEMDTVKHLLDFMYLDSVPDLDWNPTLKLCAAANKYGVVGLREKCCEILKSKLCVQNVIPVLSLAGTLPENDLMEFVQEFILEHEGLITPSYDWENFVNEESPLAARVMLFLSRKRTAAQH